MFLTVRFEKTQVIRTLESSRNFIMVGRKYGELLLKDLRCSRRHAVFFLGSEGELRIKDLSSSNGTLVDDVRVKSSVVTEGSTVRLGRTNLAVIAYGKGTKERE